MPEQDPIIRVKGLTAQYGDDIILDNIIFDVYPKEIIGILGPSGCGKSTLLRHMVGLNDTACGSVEIHGINICSDDDRVYQQALRRIGILFQGGALFGSMTLGENIALAIEAYTELPKKAVLEIVRIKLCMVGLGGYEKYLPSEISGGMRKRAALARAMALNPEILFLDEPSAGLDPVTSAEIDDLILKINAATGTTMVIVTHELDSIFALAKRVIMLDKSERGIIAEGNPHELKTNSDDIRVRRFFNRKANGN